MTRPDEQFPDDFSPEYFNDPSDQTRKEFADVLASIAVTTSYQRETAHMVAIGDNIYQHDGGPGCLVWSLMHESFSADGNQLSQAATLHVSAKYDGKTYRWTNGSDAKPAGYEEIADMQIATSHVIAPLPDEQKIPIVQALSAISYEPEPEIITANVKAIAATSGWPREIRLSTASTASFANGAHLAAEELTVDSQLDIAPSGDEIVKQITLIQPDESYYSYCLYSGGREEIQLGSPINRGRFIKDLQDSILSYKLGLNSATEGKMTAMIAALKQAVSSGIIDPK